MARLGLWFLLAAAFLVTPVLAQDPRPPVSAGVGQAVLIGTNSIQLDRDVVVVSGDVIVNNAATSPVLGEKELSLDRGVSTPAGYKIAAHGVDLDGGAVAGGDVHYNSLSNNGNIAGAQVTPLALPVFAVLPEELFRGAGTSNVTVPAGATVDLESGEYGTLVIGKDATVRFRGGGYTFASISAAKGVALRFMAASTVVVNGGVALDKECVIGPAAGAPITAAHIQIQVHGSSMTTDQDCGILANVFVTAGTLVIGQHSEAIGQFIARDIRAQRSVRFTLESGLNLPPVANPQNVFTNGSGSVTIPLTASDPENAALSFSIAVAPAAGTLSAVVATSPDSATVTYSPASGANAADSFTFRATDPGGAVGQAVVSINPPKEEPPPPPPGTVVADDGAATTSQEVAATLLLTANAPAGVPVTFSIVANTGPFHGTLGSLVQGTETPQRSATVLYTPAAGYVGNDSLQFEACGVINGTPACDAATFAIQVLDLRRRPPGGPLANDVNVGTPADTEVVISLFGTSTNALRLKPMAAFLDPVEIAGNVADANNDGTGDNHNALPGSAPVFMSAAVGSSGGAGSNGTVRMQFEWDISGFNGTIGNLVSANVMLPTNRGTTDSLNTYFWAGGVDGDGLLTDSDFALPAERIAGAVMPVPQTMQIGADGTFSFSVFAELKQAIEAGFDHFVIQGRVDESLTSGRGLQVRTTASGNQQNFAVPMLDLATPGIVFHTTVRILSLPQSGTLLDGNNNVISSVPYTLPSSIVKYTPNFGFTGSDQFEFELDNGFEVDSAFANITVTFTTCLENVLACNDGRQQ